MAAWQASKVQVLKLYLTNVKFPPWYFKCLPISHWSTNFNAAFFWWIGINISSFEKIGLKFHLYMQSYLWLADTFNVLSKLSEKMTLGKLLVLNVFIKNYSSNFIFSVVTVPLLNCLLAKNNSNSSIISWPFIGLSDSTGVPKMYILM